MHMTHTRTIAGLIGVMLSAAGLTVSGAAQTTAPGVDIVVPHESWSCGLPGGIPRPETGTGGVGLTFFESAR